MVSPQFSLPIPVTVIKIIPHRQAQRHVRRGTWTQGHSAIDTCCQRENRFSLIDSYWLYQPHSQVGPCSSGDDYHKMKLVAFLWTFAFTFGIFCLTVSLLACLLCFWFWVLGVFFFFWDRARGREGENTCKVGWVGRWDDLGGFGRRETQSNYSVKKKKTFNENIRQSQIFDLQCLVCKIC